MLFAFVIGLPELRRTQQSYGFWKVRHVDKKEEPELDSCLAPAGGDQTKQEVGLNL